MKALRHIFLLSLCFSAFFAQASEALAANSKDEAIKLYDKSIQLWINRRFEDSGKALLEAYKADPSNEKVLYRLCNIAVGSLARQYKPGHGLQNVLRKCQKKFKADLSADSSNPNLNFAYYRTLGLPKTSRKKQFERLASKYPDNPLIRAYYARFYIDGGFSNLPRARKMLQEMLNKNPSWSLGWRRLGDSYNGYIDKRFRDAKKGTACFKVAFILGEEPHCYFRGGRDLDERVCMTRMAWLLNAYNEGCPLSCGYWSLSTLANAMKSLYKSGHSEIAESYFKELSNLLAIISRYRFCTGGMAYRASFKNPVYKARNDFYAKHPKKAYLKEMKYEDLLN